MLCQLTFTPIVLARNIQTNGALFARACVSAMRWSVDIVLNFRTGFCRGAEREMMPRQVAMNRMRSWFSLDFAVVTCNWLNVVSLVLQPQFETGVVFKMLRFTRLARPARAFMIRMMHAVRVLEEFMEVHLPPACRLMFQPCTLLFAFMWMEHEMALGIAGPTDTGLRWMDFMALNPDTPFVEATWLYQYTSSC